MRYRVYISIDVLAASPLEARDKVQGLADTINAKDAKNKAWIYKVAEVFEDTEANRIKKYKGVTND